MDENKTSEKIENETAGENSSEKTVENTSETTNKLGGKFLEWLNQYSDEEKYPKQPTPWFVYVLSVPVGFCVIWLVRRGMISLAESFGTTDKIDTPFSWVMCFILFLLFSLLFVILYQCIARYGLSVAADVLPKILLIAVSILALGLLVFFFCISEYFGSVMVGIFWAILVNNALKKRS